MDEQHMKKAKQQKNRWEDYIHSALLFALALTVCLCFWNEYQHLKLNRQYESLIEQKEKLNQNDAVIQEKQNALNQIFEQRIELLEEITDQLQGRFELQELEVQ